MTTKKLTIATLTDEDFDWLTSARDTRLWRILDASMAPDLLPGDAVYVSPRLAPLTGDLILARLADGSCLLRRYKARGRMPGEVVGVAFMDLRKMRPGGRPRSKWGTRP
jgi:hypothetical protein